MSCEHCRAYSVSYCPVCEEGKEEMVICPECGGLGHEPFVAFDTLTRQDVECTEAAYICLPDDEDEAEAKGQRYCKQDLCICPTCLGEGRIIKQLW